MQKSICILFLAFLGFTACQPDGNKQQNPATAESGMTSAADKTGEKSVNTSPFKDPDNPKSAKVAAALTKNYWVTTAYFKPKEAGANKKNQGNWYQFNIDGTFTFGHFEEELAKGKWSFKDAGQNGQIQISADNTNYSGLWSIKLGKDDELMIWVGTEVYKTNGVQQRLENLLFIPKNRTELGMS